MCLLCTEISKQKMTNHEVARAYREMDMEDIHYADVMVAISNNYDLDEIARELGKLYILENEKK